MANLQERRDKDGKLISYSIRVHRGRGSDGKQLKPFTTTFKVNPNWSEKTARKKAEAFAAVYEKECKEGSRSDSRVKFEEYCEYVIDMKEQEGVKHSTILRYRNYTKRIYPAIGHIRLCDIRPDILNSFYHDLAKPGAKLHSDEGLAPKNIYEHHRLISTVMGTAVKEGLIVSNPAKRATPPKVPKKDVNYFQPEEVEAIRDALEEEPLQWKTMVHVFLVSGARRGEVLGLKWKEVDFRNDQIHICNNILYSADRGVYEDTPKTANSIRYISMPHQTMELLKEYKVWQDSEKERLSDLYTDKGFVFCRPDGSALNPGCVWTWLKNFSERHDLPHINPHAFRHTLASYLYFGGADAVSISKRLGHSHVSTTQDIYAHIIEKADTRNAEIISNLMLESHELELQK